MKRTLLIVIIAVILFALLLYALQVGRQHAAPPVNDPPAPALIVRVLDVGQGDAMYIRNGESRVIVDGGPDRVRFGKLLDSLGLNGTTIDVVVLTHAHADHYRGLLALFDSRRRIKIRYVFENQDPSTAGTLAVLRDSIIARIHRDSLVYRSTDDPCGDGRPVCVITLKGGAKLDLMKPLPAPASANNRSIPIKLVGPDSASFTMWLAGDAEREALRYFTKAGYTRTPGMRVDVLKADHHGSCNGVTAAYLRQLRPSWVIASLGAQNEYGHMHQQAKEMYTKAGVPWYRTDQNGTVTIRVPGTPGSGYTVEPSRGNANAKGPSDRVTRGGCGG